VAYDPRPDGLIRALEQLRDLGGRVAEGDDFLVVSEDQVRTRVGWELLPWFARTTSLFVLSPEQASDAERQLPRPVGQPWAGLLLMKTRLYGWRCTVLVRPDGRLAPP
jgi:hypothetical protein